MCHKKAIYYFVCEKNASAGRLLWVTRIIGVKITTFVLFSFCRSPPSVPQLLNRGQP